MFDHRTIIELVTSIGLTAFYCIFNSIDGIANALFDCDVHGISFKCIIPNSRFEIDDTVLRVVYVVSSLIL